MVVVGCYGAEGEGGGWFGWWFTVDLCVSEFGLRLGCKGGVAVVGSIVGNRLYRWGSGLSSGIGYVVTVVVLASRVTVDQVVMVGEGLVNRTDRWVESGWTGGVGFSGARPISRVNRMGC
ncbi:hypothetical protein V6N12_067887 [Hibiscus sabdariffa]|uniref:Transmembrane protein n=1 Tax=Hibiscus sabdariffa TaxID=183260 RepID=A0ABR2FP18_9ROSI